MGRKLDLSGLSDNEAEHVLQVVQRDMRLRKKEEERLSELKQELDEEGSRCLLLSRQSCFNQRCCIRCCSPFIFLLNPKRQCRDCRYNVCKACRVYNKREKAWLCSSCQKSRLLKTQSLEWFYMNVKKRFKRFGSAKVLKTLYRKHLAEHSALSELTEGSACDESICNEGSVCGSDSTFYRQTEEHSMAETLAVAMRVAEEAIDEAISKAECDTASQEKQNEALYLREHRGELIEELANTIVQKIIKRRKTLAEIRTEYDHDWARERNAELQHHHRTIDQASSSLKRHPNLWRSHSAFSLLDNDPPGLMQESPRALKKEAVGSPLAAWKSVDRLDNAGVSSVLKSPDGNWIVLQSAQLSRPSLLTKRKSLVYSALERESGVVSAYEGLGSDNESKQEGDSSWGAVLQRIHRKMTDSNSNLHGSTDSIPQLTTSRRGSRDDLVLDLGANWKLSKPLLKRRVPVEIRKPSSSVRPSIIDVNFNLEEAGGEGVVEAEGEKVRRSRKKRSKKEAASSSMSDLKNTDNHTPHPCEAVTSDTLTSGATTPEPLNPEGDVTGREACQVEELAFKLHQLAGHAPEASAQGGDVDEDRDTGYNGQREGRRNRTKEGDEEDERQWKMEIDLDGGRTEDEEEKGMDDEEMKNRLYRLVAQSRLTYFSSTDDELDRGGQSDGDWDRDEDAEVDDEDLEKREGLTYKLCRLENQVRASQFSSTEDELDRVGVETREGEEEEELAVKVCRLASQVSADQFSSTEDELDRAGRGEEGEETAEEETLWKLQAKKAVQAAQLRDLASLVSASQFSSTEDELDRFGEQEVDGGGVKRSSAEMWEGAAGRRRSIGDIDEEMFDLRDESDERKEATVTSKNVLNRQTKAEADETEAEERVTEADMTTEGHLCDEKVEVSKGDGAGKEKTAVEAERAEEIITEARLRRETQRPEAKWREEKFQKDNREEKWETAAGSDVEEADFDKIISSMLMMTLEDMQVEAVNRESEQEETKEKTEGGRRLRENEADAQSTEDSVETQSQSDERPESAVEKPSGGCGSEKTVGNISDKQESGCSKNVQEERHISSVEERPTGGTTNETLETNEVTCERTDEKQDGRGATAADTERDTTDCERTDKEENADDTEQSSSSSLHEGLLSPEEIQNRYSAISLRSITTEVLKVLNATEELLQGMEGGDDIQLSTPVLPPNIDPMKLDQQFSRLEENVYVAAGSVFSLEAELSDLEECARGICSSTSDLELSFLEEQVAAAAAKVQQSELQISDISARINALKNAGLNVDPQSRFTKSRVPVMPVTLDSSRQMRRRLPAPPVTEDKET